MTGWVEWGPPISSVWVAGLLDVVTGACLGHTVTFGADFAVLLFFLVVVTSCRVGVSVTGLCVGFGEGGVAALSTRLQWTLFQPGSRLSALANGSARSAFGAASGLGEPPLLRTIGARLASAALASFRFAQPR